MNLNNSKFYKCTCSLHALEINTDFVKEEGEVYFSIWEYGRMNGKMSFKERLRWCWQILTKGSPWADSVVLSKEECKEIIEQLKDL